MLVVIQKEVPIAHILRQLRQVKFIKTLYHLLGFHATEDVDLSPSKLAAGDRGKTPVIVVIVEKKLVPE
jgi:hypothetical protein